MTKSSTMPNNLQAYRRKVIAFLRVSTLEQGSEDRAALPRQHNAIAQIVERHNLEIVKTISLVDVSGTSVRHAPEYQEMLSLIDSESIAGVATADMDRLMRLDDFNDFSHLQTFKETETLIFLPDLVIDLNTQSGFLMGGFQGVMGGNELTQIKKRMNEAKEAKRNRGEHPNNLLSLPFGVTYNYDDKKYLYTTEIYLIRELFRLFHDDGMQNYRELERITGIHHRTIYNLLRNELYIGYRTYTEKRSSKKNMKLDGRQGDKKKIKRSPEEVIRVKVIEKPCIDEATFWKVQEIIEHKNNEYHTKKSTVGERFLFTGFLRCGVCGERLYTASGGRNHNKDYYLCRTKKYTNVNNKGADKCDSSYIPKKCIEHTLTTFVSEVITDEVYMLEIIKNALSGNESESKQTEIQQIQKGIKKIEQGRSRILELYMDNLFTKVELDAKVGKMNDEEASLRWQLNSLERYSKPREESIEKIIEQVVSTLAEFNYWSPKQKREFLRSQIPEFSVTKEGVDGFKINFVKTLSPKGRGSWRRPLKSWPGI